VGDYWRFSQRSNSRRQSWLIDLVEGRTMPDRVLRASILFSCAILGAFLVR
jgi:hypothetical protein